MEVPPMETQFASAERAPAEELEAQAARVRRYPLLHPVLDAIPDLVLILNKHRQIVFANRAAQLFVGARDYREAQGLRPGEALQCVRACHGDPGGCGTTRFCRNCGAVQAILGSLDGHYTVRECRISRDKAGDDLDLRVWATPVTVEEEPFVIFVAADISHEKRRRVLERLFFHDILNTAGGILGMAQLLNLGEVEDTGVYVSHLLQSARKLVEDIQAQKELNAAENSELKTEARELAVPAFLGGLVTLYAAHETAKGRQLVLAEHIPEATLVSDEKLLGRVMGNMIKNALEAIPPGATVTLGAEVGEDTMVFWVHNPGVMAPDVQAQVFQRSFSTKGADRGIGAYSMKLLAERYLQGEVSFTSSEAEGTTFRLHCPAQLG